MAIDRAEDGDAAEGEPTLPDRYDPEPLHNPVERVAEHARYRASVENYGAAKDGWVQALPSLHAAWEKTCREISRTGAGNSPYPA